MDRAYHSFLLALSSYCVDTLQLQNRLITSITVRWLIVVMGYILQSLFLMLIDRCDWLF